MNESMRNVKSNNETQMQRLKEEPMLFIPENIKANLEKNSQLFEKFLNSFENFIRLNPPREVPIVEPQQQIAPSKASKQLPETDSDLQKEYDPVTVNDFGAQKSLNQSLKCYINACISENLTERAFAVLMSIRYSNKYRKRKFTLNDPELYIDLMSKYSTLCNWTRVNEIYDILIAEQIPITIQVYMNILDCLGRMKESKSNSALIKKFIEKANEQVKYKIFHDFQQYLSLFKIKICRRTFHRMISWTNPLLYVTNGHLYYELLKGMTYHSNPNIHRLSYLIQINCLTL